ncbi:glycosyltransferase involved in cell wall biosynthesis [Granulicella aggregans]|uniref:Glycosyltransferase involved in cell wall biosynthesis n=1 Tax=Granulicella aggregans TaxID=474949 RepID=A0A7W7ZH51_9BACT|nr:glycosyltransferase [Granulicella aggregans]MBB5059742.1 glycosyltransferase involved in cell wall biosynthesis [Granulicella aggregans]
MRTLHIIGTLNPASGGPAAAVSMLIEFSGPGHASEAVTLDNPSSPFLENLSYPVTALGPTRMKFGYNRRLVPWLRQNASRFDAVIVHGLWQYCGIATWRALSGKVPYFVFVHGMLDPYFKRAFPFKHLKKWAYWIAAEHWVLRSASNVLFTCTEEERLARESFWLHRWTPVVVPYGSRTPDIDLTQAAADFHQHFPHLQGRRYLLFLGRIDRKKGCDLLIDAFISTAASDPALDLVMAGPDETRWRPQLEERLRRAGISHRVHWTGMIAGTQKWGAFATCEAFVLPSHQENFGIAVAEALSCGRPVLLSDKVNIAPEIIADHAGLMETDTLQGTTNLLLCWMKMSQAERETMGANALACFQSRFDMKANVTIFNDLLEAAAHLQSNEQLTPASR